MTPRLGGLLVAAALAVVVVGPARPAAAEDVVFAQVTQWNPITTDGYPRYLVRTNWRAVDTATQADVVGREVVIFVEVPFGWTAQESNAAVRTAVADYLFLLTGRLVAPDAVRLTGHMYEKPTVVVDDEPRRDRRGGKR